MPGSNARVVVIVEDDSSMRQALDRILRLGGWVPAIYSSAEALLAEHDRAPGSIARAACLVLDVQLPGLSGFELHDRLSAVGPMPPVTTTTTAPAWVGWAAWVGWVAWA